MWPLLVLATLSADVREDGAPVRSTRAVAESANFTVHSHVAAYDARQIAQSCEAWREHLQEKWLGADGPQTWSPQCLVTVHASRETYLAAVGRGGERSYGSSLVDSGSGHITERRIDLLLDSRGQLSALGHELSHIVLADAFPGSQPPAWATEGIAILADSAEKKGLHQRDFEHAAQRHSHFRLVELTDLAGYPAPERIPAFYGQSASLVEFLCQTGGSKNLVPFLKLAASHGYDHALREIYEIAGLSRLEHDWLRSR